MRSLWISFLVGLLGFVAQAQELSDRLYKAGFENVLINDSEDTLKIFFEHREFRSPFHSMKYASFLLKEQSDINIKNIFWIPVVRNQPIGSYTAQEYKFKEPNDSELQFFKENNKPWKNYRWNFRIRPRIKSRFGFYSDPFETKLNIILDSRVYLARGLSVQTGISFPVTNNLDNHDLKPRLAPSMLHYFVQPANSHFLGLSVGTFYDDRYGVDLEYRFNDLNSPWSFGLATGLTGFYWLYAGGSYTEPLDDFYATADVELRLPIENISLKLTAGQFLVKDKGLRADLIKQFGTIDVGMHASFTSIGNTIGFQFATPLFPGKIYRSSKLELRTTEEFRWEYSYNNAEPVARSFKLGMPRLSDLLRHYNAAYIKSF
jgi:hypothetical protein